jgi:hypothetical protein
LIINTQIPFDYFDIVYLITDRDQKPYQVTGIKLTPGSEVVIQLQSGTMESWHYIGEISTEKNTQYA